MTDQPAISRRICDMTASEAIALLEVEAEGQANPSTAERPATVAALPVSAIDVVEALFQPRPVAEWHISPMISAIKAGRGLPPLLVYRVGSRTLLLDGHHRREAYRRAKFAKPVPVEFFEGTPREAVLEARARNSTPKLPMSGAERMNDAWRLVKLGGLSKAQISKAANVSDGIVATMRRALKTLSTEDAEGCRTWREARDRAQGKEGWTAMKDNEREARLEAIAEDWTSRLGRTFGTKLSRQPEIAAKALADYFGRNLPEMVRYLREHLPEADADELEFGDF